MSLRVRDQSESARKKSRLGASRRRGAGWRQHRAYVHSRLMILFSEQPPPEAKLRPQLIAAIPGAIIGLAVAIALRWTVLSPPARVLLSTLPMFFPFGFLNPLNAKLPV